MARRPSVWFREQTGQFYTTVDGKQVPLGSDRAEADKLFHRLLGGTGLPEPCTVSFAEIADEYLSECEQTKSERTFTHQKYFLQDFVTRVAKRRPAAGLRKGDVTAWLAAHGKAWGHNTQVTARSILKACIKWAVEEDHLDADPLKAVKPGATWRRERILTPDERTRIKAAAGSPLFRNLLTFLELTGCRPFSEACALTADMVDWDAGSVTFAKHKNARKGKTRVVYLAPALVPLLKEWCRERPKGPLFHTKNGIAYNRSNVGGLIRRLETKLDMPRWNLYSWRHSWFSDALERGVPAALLAEIGGNSPATLNKYYNHLDQKKAALRQAAANAVGSA